MNILITGSSGFLGRNLVTAILKQFSHDSLTIVSSIANEQYYTIQYNDDFSISLGKNEDINRLSKIDVLIHAGAFTPKDNSQGNSICGSNSNIKFTENLLNLPLSNLKKIIYLSTLDVYDAKGVINESSDIKPSSLYGHSKYYCEEMIRFFCEQHSIYSHILRIGHVYGPGEEVYKKFMPIAIRRLIASEPVELWGSGEELRTFIFIDDVIQACVKAIYLTEDVGPINVVGSKSISIAGLLRKIEKILGVTGEVKVMEASSSARDFVFDNRKLKKYLLSNETDLDDGLIAEIEYMKVRN